MTHFSPILIIDNRDSFTYNIVDLLHKAEAPFVKVVDSREYATLSDWLFFIKKEAFSHIIIGPGPGAPNDYYHIVQLIPHITEIAPILGICLGHQMIIHAYGGHVIPTGAPVHGKASPIRHNGKSLLFQKIPSPCIVGRYHSLAAYSLPAVLTLSAYIDDEAIQQRLVMALEHTEKAIYGVQFHPESFLSEHGITLISNFIQISI